MKMKKKLKSLGPFEVLHMAEAHSDVECMKSIYLKMHLTKRFWLMSKSRLLCNRGSLINSLKDIVWTWTMTTTL